MGWNYTDKLVSLFQEAMSGNGTSHQGRVDNPDGIGHYGSIACGDAIVFSFKVEKNDDPKLDRMVEAKYETFGCTSAISSSEALCYIIEETHPTVLEALNIKSKDIAQFLNGLPTQKMHCSVMGAEVIREAVKDWAKKRNYDLNLGSDKDEDDKSRLVCACCDKTENQLKRAIQDLMITDVDDLIKKTEAGSKCGSCINAPGGLRDMVEEYKQKISDQIKPMSMHDEFDDRETEQQIEAVVETIIIPQLARTGRSFRLVKVKRDLVYCEIEGIYDQKLITLIQNVLRELIHPDLRIIDF